MATWVCPHCAAPVPRDDGWAGAALATLMPAPAVPDMASQVSCPSCARVFAASDLRHEAADRFATPGKVVALFAVLVLVWAAAGWFTR